jgi:flagellar biosynthesis anti-sigma factor FlgM
MTDAISTNNRVKTPNPASEQRANTTARDTPRSAESRPASAIVELSSDQILKEMNNIPEVDSGRIESIKNALANGEYKPDPDLIARKFSEIENLLP